MTGAICTTLHVYALHFRNEYDWQIIPVRPSICSNFRICGSFEKEATGLTDLQAVRSFERNLNIPIDYNYVDTDGESIKI